MNMLQEKTSSPTSRLIIEAEQENYSKLAAFLNQNNLVHRHLDWVSALDWVGSHPYLIEISDRQLQAVLCATPENDEVAWLRVFGVRKDLSAGEHWDQLLPRAIQKLRDMKINCLAGLALHPWFEALLMDSEFVNKQNIIVLEWQGELPKTTLHDADIQIRQMQSEDLLAVQRIDRLAFPPLWQNSLDGLSRAFGQTGISTVALIKGEIVGYQISTSMTIYGHLARLAVHPGYQRKGIANSLLFDLLRRFKQRGIWRITVNTQSDNEPSITLYKKFRFVKTPETFRVYQMAIN
jgi:ribosomal protein S18 acetylase RimI-like enzyme